MIEMPIHHEPELATIHVLRPRNRAQHAGVAVPVRRGAGAQASEPYDRRTTCRLIDLAHARHQRRSAPRFHPPEGTAA